MSVGLATKPGTSTHPTDGIASYVFPTNAPATSAGSGPAQKSHLASVVVRPATTPPNPATGRAASCPVAPQTPFWVARSMLQARSDITPVAKSTFHSHSALSCAVAIATPVPPPDDPEKVHAFQATRP